MVHLEASGLFKQFRVEEIQAETVEYNKRKKVVHMVQQSGPKAFDLFYQALQKTDQTHLANLLKPYVMVLSPGSTPLELYPRKPATMVDTTQRVKFEAYTKLTRSQAGSDASNEVEKDEYGDTELHSAVLSRNLDKVKSVVNKLHQAKDFAAVNAKNWSAQTPLYLATLTNQVEVMKYLLEYGAQLQLETDAGNNCIHAAVKEGHEVALKILLEALWKRDCRNANVLNAVDNDGKTAMHMAQFGNRWRCMELLLRAGADINAGDRTAGLSPLHHAVKDAHAQSYIYLLMQSTVDPDKRAYNGSTPLHIAADRGNYVARMAADQCRC
ncbi:PREDICTED: nuclear factor NF-kappa-B p105 subunit-like [Priapulus caudatus]|uniref:Nuclear factor NF-kappa-B p105 subunit-like n=1 Tax=Priapulus caudatus TaxID=37621 RepID=A0ABM1E9R5_PRICU|nr:PREDICTED: nuclear factor NF-kappa-B p105 subunit-like [Priapulus caudatus]